MKGNVLANIPSYYMKLRRD
uniref:Uncharacterized protein n=1 Tax=Rhizophora mucronata TaxID=61149 RepID=A0A2P2PH95_RHIMU